MSAPNCPLHAIARPAMQALALAMFFAPAQTGEPRALFDGDNAAGVFNVGW